MYSIKNVIKEYLKRNFAESGIESVYGNYWIRFELGGSIKNGSVKRINQVVSRALEIYNQTVGNDELVMIIQEFPNELFDKNNEYKEYLYSLIGTNNQQKFVKYKGPFEQTYIDTDEFGNKFELKFEDDEQCDLVIYKLKRSYLEIEKIIQGMANLEMGKKPCIPQKIYFLSMITGTSFYMYDDRGCDTWAKSKVGLLPVYLNLNEWILDYNRKEIDSLFE
jgi:hypothetical protein